MNTRIRIIIQVILIILLYADCTLSQSALSEYDFKNPVQYKLHKKLREISGLACSRDRKLFCHEDENGIIYQLDDSSGKIINKFNIDAPTIHRDFEGLAIVRDTFYLIVSSGELYEFTRPKISEASSYKIYQTGLAKYNNVEGLCYDPATNSLLLACKESSSNSPDNRSIFSFDLVEKKLILEPRFILSIKELEHRFKMKNFSPTAIEYNSKTNTYFILSSHVKAIIEITTDGKILNCIRLSGKLHKQPEGLTFNSDGNLIISDEGKHGNASLTIYKLKSITQ